MSISLTRSTSVRAGLAQRVRIVLLAADGLPNAEIARRTGTSRPTELVGVAPVGSPGSCAGGGQSVDGRLRSVGPAPVLLKPRSADERRR